MFLLLLEVGSFFEATYFRQKRMVTYSQQQNKMIFKLTKFKRDAWSGHKNYMFCAVNIAPEIGKRGKPVSGLTDKDQKQLEKDLFLQPGELSENSPFWHDYFIAFNIEGITLDDENANDRLALHVLKSMRKVAFGKEQLKTKAKAEYMLTSDEKIEAEDDDVLSIKEDAYALLSDATPAKLRQIYVVLLKQKKNGVVVDVSNMSDKALKNGLRTIIESNATSFNTVAKDTKLNLKAEIIELVTKRIISTTNAGYFRGPDQIAYDLDSMVNYMEDPHNQSQVILFKSELKAKK